MFDQPPGPRRKIAIIGGGISGLSAAYYLAPHHDVTVYEAANRLGGHARTVMAGLRGDQPVDTGFIVFNYATYPNLTRLFHDLDVPVIKSNMSFCASIDEGRLEYGLNNVASIIAQKRNLLRPRFYQMLRDILRFGKEAEGIAKDGQSIGELLDTLKMGQWFRDYYLLPMSGAIWSTPTREIDQFPAQTLLRFFRNHALLAGCPQHQWWTVKGGSIAYVRRLQAALLRLGCQIRTDSPVRQISREKYGVTVVSGQGDLAQFDDVILSCHSDQALRLLGAGATAAERQALSAIRYQPNRAVLHADSGQMPKTRACWASWAYREQQGGIGVTYWMNRLQGIPESDPLFVTLNPTGEIAADKIYDQAEFAHPIFDQAALEAQKTIRQIQGQNRTWYAGAWNRHGFHEDGIASALRVVRQISSPQFGKTSYVAATDHDEIEFPVDLRAAS